MLLPKRLLTRLLWAWSVLWACSPAGAEVRPWADAGGVPMLRAEFAGMVDGKVQLRHESGESVQIRLEELSRKDQEFVFTQVQRATPQEVVKFAEPAVVCVETDKGLGSGFIADEQGIVVTNHHVVEGVAKAKIVLKDKTELPVIGFITCDPGRDIALLKVASPKPLPVLSVADAIPEKLDEVIAIGAPRGLSFTATEGAVSSVRTTDEILEGARRLNPAAVSILDDYALDSLWIQTTAAISSGNSGGPLVNLRGQVVGINTWSKLDGQSLNFALACTEIRKIYEAAPKDQCHSLLEIPRIRPTDSSSPSQALAATGPFSIKLPSGTTVSNSTFQLDISAIERDPGDDCMMLQGKNGFKIVACHVRGIPNGPTLATYPDGHPCSYVEYDNGTRSGVLTTWNEAGQRVLFAKYAKGRQHGLCCLFDQGSLRLILECEGDQVEAVHLVLSASLSKSFSGEAEASRDPDARACLEEYKRINQEIDENEKDFRKTVRDEEERLRKVRVSQNNPAKRRNIQQRGDQRASEHNVLIQQLRRRAGI
jgi:S1-C subfamily serine protease